MNSTFGGGNMASFSYARNEVFHFVGGLIVSLRPLAFAKPAFSFVGPDWLSMFPDSSAPPAWAITSRSAFDNPNADEDILL